EPVTWLVCPSSTRWPPGEYTVRLSALIPTVSSNEAVTCCGAVRTTLPSAGWVDVSAACATTAAASRPVVAADPVVAARDAGAVAMTAAAAATAAAASRASPGRRARLTAGGPAGRAARPPRRPPARAARRR